MKKSLLKQLMIAAIMVFSVSLFGQEMLLNGGFENWDNTTTPTDWDHVENTQQESNGSMYVHGGIYSAKHTGGTKDLGQYITGITPGESYTLTIWYMVVENDGTDSRIWSYWRSGGSNLGDNANELRGPNNQYLDNNGGVWTEYTVTLDAPATADEFYFEVRTYSGAITYWDDFSFFHNEAAAVAKPTFNPAAGTYYDDVEVELSCSTGGATIFYTTNGDDPTTDGTEYFSPFDITTTTTVKAAAYLAPGPNKDAGEWSDIAEATYTIEDPIEVATLADLRAAYNNKSATVYEVTGEVVMTFDAGGSRNQKYVQDATAGILIDDASGTITTSYNQYDGITGLIGSLSTYNGMLQFVPVADPGAATSTGNSVTPVELSIEEMNDEHETYESMLVTIMAVHFDESLVGTNFQTYTTNYDIFDNDGFEGVMRAHFSGANYMGNPIPAGNQDITGLQIEYNGTAQVAPREMADFTESTTPVIPIGSTGIMIAGLLMAAVIVIRKGRLF